MTKSKPYELKINERGQLDIIDHIEGKKRNAICIYNDLGVPPFSSAKAICNKLNEQEEEISKLTCEVVRLRLEPQLKQNKKSIKDVVEVNNFLKEQDKTIKELEETIQELDDMNSLIKDEIDKKIAVLTDAKIKSFQNGDEELLGKIKFSIQVLRELKEVILE